VVLTAEITATIKLRHYRMFKVDRHLMQGLFTGLSTGTYPRISQAPRRDVQNKCTAFSTESSTGFPQFVN
jgi:hypothetical protein